MKGIVATQNLARRIRILTVSMGGEGPEVLKPNSIDQCPLVWFFYFEEFVTHCVIFFLFMAPQNPTSIWLHLSQIDTDRLVILCHIPSTERNKIDTWPKTRQTALYSQIIC